MFIYPHQCGGLTGGLTGARRHLQNTLKKPLKNYNSKTTQNTLTITWGIFGYPQV